MSNSSESINTEVYYIDNSGKSKHFLNLDNEGMPIYILPEKEHGRICTEICSVLYESYKKSQ